MPDQRAIPAARHAIAATEEATDAIAGVTGLTRGQLTIGVIRTPGPLSIPALLARYHRRHPAVMLRLIHDSVTSLVRRTADGEVDLAIVDLPLGPQADRVDARALESKPLRLAVSSDDPLADRRRVRLAELGDRDFVEYRADSSLRASIDQACTEPRIPRELLLVTALGHRPSPSPRALLAMMDGALA
jgi:DNA-binding transcriptional LysR family regulator